MAAAVAEEAALVADVLASEALVVAVDADDDADVAELAAAVAELAALDADVLASDALVVAVVADEAAAVAELAALVACVVAVAASTIKVYFAELVLVVRGCDPDEV